MQWSSSFSSYCLLSYYVFNDAEKAFHSQFSWLQHWMKKIYQRLVTVYWTCKYVFYTFHSTNSQEIFFPRLFPNGNRGSAYFWTYLIKLHLWDLSICYSVPPCHSADGNSRCLTFPRVPTLPPSLPPASHPLRLHHGLPVHQSIICRAVVLNLVHSDAGDMALRWPA